MLSEVISLKFLLSHGQQRCSLKAFIYSLVSDASVRRTISGLDGNSGRHVFLLPKRVKNIRFGVRQYGGMVTGILTLMYLLLAVIKLNLDDRFGLVESHLTRHLLDRSPDWRLPVTSSTNFRIQYRTAVSKGASNFKTSRRKLLVCQ